MSNFGAFVQQGPTTAITTGSSASMPVQVNANGSPNMCAYLIVATQAAIVSITPQSANVVTPVSGTPANGIYIPANVPVVLEGPPNAWFSAMEAPSGTAGTVYVTPGDGATH